MASRVALSLAVALAALAAVPTADPPPDRTAVLDRFEGERAVLVLDDRRAPLAVDRSALPPAGRHAGAVFRVRVAHGTLASVRYDPGRTRRRAREARGRVDRLADPLSVRENGRGADSGSKEEWGRSAPERCRRAGVGRPRR